MADLFAGRYALGELLGAGGMARVYRAHDTRLHRTVAIKLVPAASAEPMSRQRFVREARSAAAFTHPNAVALFDAGEADGYLYLVMELVEGESLAERLARTGRLEARDAAGIATGVLAALAAAHAVGVLHRDVKPGNVLLGASGAVKLADFGIAKRLDDAAGDVTVVGDIVGTPKYLAPELVAGAPASEASDVYAVGVMLYEMLAGRPPFDADTPLATALAHRDEPVPNVAALRPGVPPALASAARIALAKDPARRFGSAAEMMAAVAGRRPTPTVPGATQASPPGRSAPPAPMPATEAFTAHGYRRGRASWWWAAAAVALVAGAAGLIFVVVNGDDPNGATPTTERSEGAIAAATTLAPSTTVETVPPTTVAATTPAPAADVSTVEGIIAVLEADPDAYGPKTRDVINDLDKIRGNGRNAEREAAKTLEHAAEWVDNGELEPAVLAMLEPVLGPIAGDGDEEDDDDD